MAQRPATGPPESDLAVRTPFAIAFDCLLLAAALAVASGACGGASAQETFPTRSAPQAELPEPIYWAQELFLIPYKWDNAGGVNTASGVKLYLSQDRGATWKEISSAKPEVQYFTYHAPHDGEYWFSMRTLDAAGRAWPTGPHQAELRVIVDTQGPAVDSFDAWLTAAGQATATWRARDPHLDPNRVRLLYRTPGDRDWQPVDGMSLTESEAGVAAGEATWQVPSGTGHLWCRLSVRDLAGNGREAGAEATPGGGQPAQLAADRQQPQSSGRDAVAGWTAQSGQPPQGWEPSPPSGQDPAWTGSAEPWPSDGQSLVPLGMPRPTGGI